MPTVLIDSSYFNFYRFYATLRWYNYSPERREIPVNLQNETFMKTFEKMWFQTLRELQKRFGVSEEDLIFARDGHDVWRYKIYADYKAQRSAVPDLESEIPGPVFRYVNANFHSRLQSKIILVEEAEADDIIAITTNYLRTVRPTEKIIIITGDHDLLQLSESDWVELYTLNKWKRITVDEPRKALMTKILAGDPSDNIPSIYKGCGKKTAEKLIADPKLLETALQKHGRKQYDLNCRLVDFAYIPEDLVEVIEGVLDVIL